MSLVRQQRKHAGTEHTFEKKWTKSGNCGTVMVPQFFGALRLRCGVLPAGNEWRSGRKE